MKKMMVVGVLIMVLFSGQSFSDNSLTAPYGFAITDPTTTTLTISWSDSNDIAADSMAVMRLSGSDSLHIAYMAGSTDTTLTGLNPHTQYILYYKILRGDSCAVSNEDTLYTPLVNLEKRKSSQELPEWVTMYGARSWLPDEITYDSLYVNGVTGLDSTMAYYAEAYSYMQAKATGDGDSVTTKLLIFDGHVLPTNLKNYGVYTYDVNEQWAFDLAASDSMTITRQGWTAPHKLVVSPMHFYVRADGQTGISTDTVTKIILRLFRRKD